VLVVDDSRFVRTTFAHILKTSFAVSEANDGERRGPRSTPIPTIVMVFTDLDMPKLNGFGLLDRMRKSDDPRIKTLPVVVISGNEEPSSKQRAKDLGANDFIAKSADAPEVLARLDNVLRLVKASKELEQTRMAVQSTATHDPLTGTHTPHYLVTEGRKHFAHARRHSGDLSVMALRLDTYESIVLAATKDIADIVVARIAKLVMEKVRAEDSVARVAQATFVVLAAGTAASHMAALAERLRASSTRRRSPIASSAQVRHQRRRGIAFLRSRQRDRGPGAARDAAAADPAQGAAAPAQAGYPGRARARAALPREPRRRPAGRPRRAVRQAAEEISKAIQAAKKPEPSLHLGDASYREFHRRSIAEREGFWSEQAKLVHWNKPFSKVSTIPGRRSPLVRRRRDQPLLQRGRPPPREPRRARRRWSGSRPRSTSKRSSPTGSCTRR
jgi:diguanylate cyclase (GGDEF)-like protein